MRTETDERASRTEGLSPAKQALLRRWEERAAGGLPTGIPHRKAGRRVPLSFAQQRLWFLDQLEPGSSAYGVPRAVRMRGALDETALQRAIDEIVARHEALRTVFRSSEEAVWQEVEETRSVPLSRIDLTRSPQDVLEEQALRRAEEEAERPFDLASGPLIRAVLMRLSEDDHVLVLTQHHIVSDAWSAGILLRELSTLYAAFSEGRPSPLPDLPIQYGDFAAWQREWLTGEVLEKQLSYWRERLLGAAPILELPTDRPRPPRQSFRGAKRSRVLPKTLVGALHELSQREGVTLFMTLLAAFQTLLHRYTGQEDISVGSPIANRNHAEIEGLIGFFTNTLVLRTTLSGDLTFRSTLQRVREVALGAYAHQDVPFEKLVEELHPERDLGRNPLFQVMFSLQNVSQEPLRLPGLTLTPLEVERSTAKFDLGMFAGEGPEGLRCHLEYNTDLFDESTAERILGHFHRLLEAIVDDPDKTLSRLPILAEAERRQLVTAATGAARRYDLYRSLPGLFEEQAERNPEATAILCGDQRWTYAELDERANRLARLLRQRGAGPEVPVALCVERSPEMYVGLLGILKAGAAYVPLEASYPKPMIAGMLKDSGARLLVTQEAVRERLALQGVESLSLDRDAQLLNRESGGRLGNRIDPDAVAYVIYTSGSTGRPKGVSGTHRAALNRFFWMWETYPFAPGEICCQKTALSFVDSIWEVFGPLLRGVPSVVIPDAAVRDPRELLGFLSGHHVTRIVLVPSLLRAILDALEESPDRRPEVELWTVSGEALSEELVERFHRTLSGSRLLNLYGSSEVAADATAFEILSGFAGGAVPIGRPISNVRAHVLDAGFEPAPIGVAGEILVGGEAVARGYHGRPDLTAERFVPDPFAGSAGDRLYRTGDLGRLTRAGDILYLGRRDHQLKIRGHRVEPGAVEAILSEHPLVRECAVVGRGLSEDRRLIAYAAAKAGESLDPMELRAFLVSRLPEAMVPSRFVCLAALPRRPNGKLDRSALPEPGQDTVSRQDDAFVAPRSALEEGLAALWAEVLERGPIGARDDFFALGGHSLLAVQLLSRVRKVFDVDLPLRSLFESPTVSGLAERIGIERRSAREPKEKALRPVSRGSEAPLSFAQKQIWFLDQLEPGNAAYNVRRAFRLSGDLDLKTLGGAIEAIVSRHEMLRTRFPVADGSPMQRVESKAPVAVAFDDVSDLPEPDREARVRDLAGEEGQTAFRLDAGPLLRVRVARVAPRDHVLFVTMHHIVCDGWSMAIFLRELRAAYAAIAAGTDPSLPELPIQYADFAMWQWERLASPASDEQLAYWKMRLEGARPVLPLPGQGPRPSRRTSRGSKRPLAFSRALTDALLAASREEGVTLYMTLLAAFAVLLSESAGSDVVVGTPTAGRNRLEMENLIGVFVNTLVLRLDLSEDPTFRELLVRVRQRVLEAFENQDLPFQKIVDELQPPRSLSHNPIFQTWFVLQTAGGRPLRLPEEEATPIELETVRVRHDLQLSLWTTARGLEGSLEYSLDLFDPERVGRLAGRLGLLLRTVAPDRGVRLSTLRERLDGLDREEGRLKEEELARSSLRKLRNMKRKAVTE